MLNKIGPVVDISVCSGELVRVVANGVCVDHVGCAAPFGSVTNKLDAAGNRIFAYQYDADNRLTNRWTPVSSNTAYGYDPAGNLLSISYLHTTNNISFAYDRRNRPTNMVDAIGTTKYSYDAAGQLLSEDGPWADDTVSYTYQNRNRMSLTVSQPNVAPWQQTYSWTARTG